jgi:hypothetical protein
VKNRCFLLFILCFVTYSFFWHGGDHNQNSHFDQTRTLVEDNSLAINKYAFNSADTVVYGQNVYPNKAPGMTFLSYPAWMFFSKLLPVFSEDKLLVENFVCYFTSLSTVAFLSSLLTVFLFLYLSKILSEEVSVLLCILYALGTLAFPYSTLFFSHQIAAALIFGSFYLSFLSRNISTEKKKNPSLLLVIGSGFLSGYAFSTEYPSGIAAMMIGIYCVWQVNWVRIGLSYLLGLFLGLIPFFTYNYLLFDRLIYFPYQFYADEKVGAFSQHAQGFLGVSFPKLENLSYLTIGFERGLLPINPIFILLPFAVVSIFLKKKYTKENVIALLIVSSYFLFNMAYGSGIVFAGGGACLGPRHIVVMLPFAIILLAELTKNKFYASTLSCLGILSITMMLMFTAVEPRIPYHYSNPLLQFTLPHYLEGRFAISSDGIFSDELITNNSIAFNLSKLIGIFGPLQIVPLICFWMFIFYKLKASFINKEATNTISRYSKGVYLYLFILIFCPVIGYFYSLSTLFFKDGIKGVFYPGVTWSSCEYDIKMMRSSLPKDHIVRIDNAMSFSWPEEDPPPYQSSFSAMWSLDIEVKQSASYDFQSESDDGSCVYVDNKLIINNWGTHTVWPESATIYLPKGKHRVDVFYSNEMFGGLLRFSWAKSGGPYRTLSKDDLNSNLIVR